VPPPQPNPFARPSPWGNLPPARIRLEGRVTSPAETQPQRSRPDSRTVMLSGFSVPPPPRPRAAADAPPERQVEPPVQPFADIPVEDAAVASPFATPVRPSNVRHRVPKAALLVGGFALAVVAGLGAAAISLTRRPPEPAAVVAAPVLPMAAPAAPVAAPVAEASALPELVADPAIQVKRAAVRAVIARKPATPKSAPPDPAALKSAPLLAVPPAGPAVAPTPLFGPAPLARAPTDPEAPIPTRTRTPD
jgi:hypothetical protein